MPGRCKRPPQPKQRTKSWGWPAQPGSNRPQGLYAHRETPEKAQQGHPLGGGHPERVSQEFRYAFHSAREDQSDMASDSDSETEDWDDIVAYDTETSRYTTVADPERATTVEPTNAGVMNNARDTARLNG